MASHSNTPHITPVATYIKVFSALVVLTLLTVAAYQVHLGTWNLVVAIIIASIKAALVVLIFMHMTHEAKFNALVFVGALLFSGVFLAYTINDTDQRAQLDEYHGARIDPANGRPAYGTSPRLEETIINANKEDDPPASE